MAGTVKEGVRPGVLDRVRGFNYRNETLVLVAMLASIWLFFPRSVPAGIYGTGVVAGASLALQAVGVVLVYRSNRIVNFAQLAIGATAGTLFALSVNFKPMLRWARHVCGPCVSSPPTSTQYAINYWISLVLALVLSVGLAWLIYQGVVRRFANAPRLMLTVATLFLARGLPWIVNSSSNFLTTRGDRAHGLGTTVQAKLPFDFTVGLHPAKFHAADVLTVATALAAGIGLMIFFRVSPTGTAIRASSENPDRAGTLGINVSKVTSRVWVVAGLLSGLAGVLAAMSTAGGNSIGVNANVLVPVLFVAVVARMTNLPLAVIGALAAGILQQATSWAFGSGVPLDGAWVLIICALLLLQRDRVSRAEIEQASTWQATRETRPTPRELRVLPTVKKWYRTGIVIAAIVALGYPWAMSPSQTSLGTITMIDAIVGLSLLVLTGWAGQISLGQFAFAAVGGYVAAVLHVPFFLAVLLGATAGAVMAVLVGIPALRLRGLHLAITSLAFAVATSAVLLNPTYLGKHLPRNLSRPVVLGLSFEDQRTFYYFTLIALVAVVLAVLGLRQSRTARVLIAARDNDRAAQSFGINIVRARLVAFAVSGFMAAFAGALYAFQQSGVKPDAFSADQSLTLFLMAVIGGLGSVAGPIIGALYLGLQTTFGATPQFQQFFTGFAPLALLLLVPGGLGKLAFDIRDAGLRRVASRNHIDAPSLTADGQPRHGDGQAPILPKARTGGGRAYVARRYEVDGQWAIDVTDSIVSAGAVATEQAEAADDGDGTFRGVVDGNEPAAAEVAP